MNHEKKEAEEQFYSPKAKPELINIPEEPEKANESPNESASELQQRDATENDISKLARKHAVNYARSLLLF